ncbi:MAG TPA: carbamoyltransferase HypF, partial [Myxococcaceae bacterium]|nr:carbamoyltransferase HypF [Myxococcaceae bacterium]
GLGLAGLVRNDSDGVWIEVEGLVEPVDRFVEALRSDLPPLARIDRLEVQTLELRGDHDFVIVHSSGRASGRAIVPPDVATCDACLAEMNDPSDRRHRYPFINCTDCGPRYTIVRDLPYDRARTTMAVFTLCPNCRAEYEDPASRRFHAEPVACAACGPRIRFEDESGSTVEEEAALLAAAAALRKGRIVAVKGIGGYHLAVDATQPGAIERLRARKGRPHKPLALMVRTLDEARALIRLGPEAEEALTSPARPIVLAPALPGAAVAPGVAPGLDELGVMLAYAPLHHLLLSTGPRALVMTSGNRSEEPIAREDDVARERLGGIADGFLSHDREIHTRADDSVVRIVAGAAQSVRRSRGWVATGISLPFEGPPLVAVGPQLKNTVCLVRGDEAFLGPHVGDLDGLEARLFFEEVIGKMARLLGVTPRAVAHDLHPDYGSTRWALESGLPRVAVQHHHAHVVSCLVDAGVTLDRPAIGVAFDGTGCGPAGDLWGGEFLVFDWTGFERRGHLRPLALPGGEAAIREPWRLALAALHDAGLPEQMLLVAIDPLRRARVAQLLPRAVRATGAGRWFDAAAALCGFGGAISYEGQAAIELEALAVDFREPYPFELAGEPFAVDLRPAVRGITADLVSGRPVSEVSGRFHETMACAVATGCRRIREVSDVRTVALSGGCFQNRRLTERSLALLQGDGFDVLLHRRVPPNDGGVSLGQAAVAAARLGGKGHHVSRNPR